MTSPETFVIDEDGARLDRVLAARFPQYTRAFIQNLIARGCARVDGTAAKASRVLKAGARVSFELPAAAPAREGRLRDWILSEDKDLIVLNKPAGLLMHPLGESWLKDVRAALSEEPSLAAALLVERPAIAAAGVPRTGIVHRLDRQTSGVLLVAKTAAAYERLTRDFKERRMEKIYRAIVRGAPESSSRVEAPIGRMPGHRRVMVTPFGKPSSTGVKVLGSAPRASLVEARPLTGRTHQIRAHLALLGHPVAGDPEHDAPGAEPVPPRLMLHAYRLSFSHPRTGKALVVKAAPPRDFREFWESCRRDAPCAG